MSGRLPHAPLVYSCVSVRYALIGDLADKINELQSVLRKGEFPLYSLQSSMTVSFDQNGPQTEKKNFHVFKSADKCSGFLVGHDGLFFQTLNYETFDKSMATAIETAVKALQDTYGSIYFSFLGNRYVDWIRPRIGETIQDYVNQPLWPVTLDNMELAGRMGLQQFRSHDGITLMIRHFGSEGHGPVPDDLVFPCSQLNSGALLSSKVGGNELIVDTDATMLIDERELSVNEVLAHLRKVHQQASTAFKSTELFTDHARKVWETE